MSAGNSSAHAGQQVTGNSASWKQLLPSLTMRTDRISLKRMICVSLMDVVHIVPSLFPFLLWFLGSSSIFVGLK